MKSFRNNIRLDYYHTFIRNLNITNGIWMIYLNVEKGFVLWQLGIFEGIFHIASLSMEVPSGMLADLFGRKISRIIGLLLYLSYLFTVLFGNQFWLIAVGFIFCGMSYAFESGSGEAIVYDSLIELNEEESYMKVQGKKEIIFQLSSTIALFIGGWIASVRYNLNFIIMLFVTATALIPILLMKEIPQNTRDKSKRFLTLMNEHFIKSTTTVFSNKRLLFLIISGALMAAPITTMFFFIQNYLDQLEVSIIFIGVTLAVHSLAGALGGYLADKLEHKFKEKLILYIVPIFIVVSLWFTLFEQIIFIPFIMLGLLDSIFYIVLNDYINKIIPSSQRATVLSFSSFSFSIVMIILFPLIGFVAELYTIRTSFMMLAIITTMSYVMLLYVLNKNKAMK